MKNYQNDLIYRDLSFRIVGLLYTTHNDLGKYCNERQYADKLEGLFKVNNISYQRELALPPSFSSEMQGRNKIDFVIDNKIILELKSKRRIERADYYQLQRYLRAFDKKLGILVNFRQKNLALKRILNSAKKDY